jgi:hypothetical protein
VGELVDDAFVACTVQWRIANAKHANGECVKRLSDRLQPVRAIGAFGRHGMRSQTGPSRKHQLITAYTAVVTHDSAIWDEALHTEVYRSQLSIPFPPLPCSIGAEQTAENRF